MKLDMRKVLLNTSFAICILLFICSNALAASNSTDDRKSFLDEQAENTDPILQPFTQWIANNIVAGFALLGGCYLLYDGVMERRKRKQGKTNDASEHHNDLIEDAKMLGLALVLFAVFVAAVKSDMIGLL